MSLFKDIQTRVVALEEADQAGLDSGFVLDTFLSLKSAIAKLEFEAHQNNIKPLTKLDSNFVIDTFISLKGAIEEMGIKLGNLDLSSRHTRDRVTELDGRLDTSVLFQANLRSRITDLEAKFIKLENPPPQTPTQANPFETEEDCEAELKDPSPAKPSDKPILPKPNIWCCKDRPFDFIPSDNKWVCTGCGREFLTRSV